MYASGGSDGVLTFVYTVSPADQSRDLDVDSDISLAIPAGASIEVGKCRASTLELKGYALADN